VPNFEAPIVVASLAALADIHVAELDDGVIAYVQSTKQYFDLDKVSGAVANGVTIIAPNIGSPIAGAASARWILQVGAVGPVGPQGPVGPAGPAGAPAVTNYGSFFALMPGDNAGTVGLGTAVEFPQDGPANDPVGGIRRSSATQVILPLVGTYEVSWQVSVTEPGQLVLALGGIEQLPTTAGRATGTSQITNDVLITTSVPNTVLTVQNPAGNAAALTITPIAGGTLSVSAWLVVKQIA
jgi:hypothetical protein